MDYKKEPILKHMKHNWQIYTFFILPIAYYIIFKYLPMAGNIIAFRKYRGGGSIFGVEWSGLKYFKQFMGDSAFWRAFRNNISLSVSYLCISFPLTLLFAVLLNEIMSLTFKKFVQTVSYLPHFISMVIVCGMVKEFVSMSGPLNKLLTMIGYEKIQFMALPQWFPAIYVISGVWQALGWDTILYLAAMSNIDVELYDAAKIDGCNRFNQIWHVTLPGIMSTIMTLLILDIGGIMGANFEKIILLYSPLTYKTADVISTYVYRMGIGSGNMSYATAVGLFEGIIGFILVYTANSISKKLSGSSLW